MPSRSDLMLFCPPQPPMRLDSHERVVIGRHRDCEFAIRKRDISRRHSEIVPSDDGFIVRDLGSTNGTYVNGMRVDREQLLLPGDRIEIGSTMITFCEIKTEIEVSPPDSCPEETMVFTRPREGFNGDLAEIPAFALLQVLEIGNKTGVLEIDSSNGMGRLWLQAGAPIHAETDKQLGFDAAVAIAHIDAGQFRFESDVDSPARTIQASVTELLLEAARQHDESKISD